ncbi:MAG: STAS domain-containing protein [Shimia sp.]
MSFDALATLAERAVAQPCAITLVADQVEDCEFGGLWRLLTLSRLLHTRGHSFEIDEMSDPCKADIAKFGVDASNLAEGQLWD